jgi:4-hydroxy-tetrahydrodipicolinate reductase
MASVLAAYPEYVVSIEETHHTQKKDSPSGTAKTLLAHLQDFYPTQAIPIIDHRIDPVVGIHTTHYRSEVDSMHFTHEAHSRDGFAGGALMAAKWLQGRKGVYSMKDVIA